MGNVKGVELREVTPSDVDRIYGWVIKPWYVNEFAGNAIPTPVCTLDAQGSNTSRTDTVRVGGISETNP